MSLNAATMEDMIQNCPAWCKSHPEEVKAYLEAKGRLEHDNHEQAKALGIGYKRGHIGSGTFKGAESALIADTFGSPKGVLIQGR